MFTFPVALLTPGDSNAVNIQGTGTPSAEIAGSGTLAYAINITGTGTPSDERAGAGTVLSTLTLTGAGTPSAEIAGAGTTAIALLNITGTGTPSDERAGAGTVQTGTVITVQGAGTPSDERAGAGTLLSTVSIQGAGTPSDEIAGAGTVQVIQVVSIQGAGTPSDEIAGAGTILVLQPETAALLARFGGTYSSTRQTAIDALIAGLKADGLWSTIDVLHIVAGSANQADGLLNWKSTSFNLSITGTLTYTLGRNFSGFSTSNYLTDGFVPSTAGGNFAQNSATIAVYSTGNGQSVGVAIGGNSASSTTHSQIVLRDTSNRASITNNAGSTQTTSATNSILTAVGLTTNTRTASNAIALYKNATSIITGTTASTGNLSVQHFTGAQNNNDTPATADANLALVAQVKASGWNATQVSNFYARLNTYLQALKQTTYTLTYSSNGDTNGVFYLLGTNTGMAVWANPAYSSNPTSDSSYNTNAAVLLSASGYSSGAVNLLTDRTTGNFQTTNVVSSWVRVDLGVFRTLSCDRYSIRHNTTTSNYLRNWRLQGSNDNTNWTDLDVRTSDTTINAASAWGTFTPNQNVTTAFRWFRILSTGVDSGGTSQAITLGEWELYGTLTIGSPTTFTNSGLNGDQAGILYYLASTQSSLNWCNGWVNPHASGAVTVSASSVASGNVAMLVSRATNVFYTNNAAGSWIQLDFGASRTVRVDSYQLRNYATAPYIRNWNLQGSNDGSSWTNLDIRTNDTTFTATSQWGNWTANQGNTSFWRYIRILATGTDSAGTNWLGIAGIELYGAIA